MAIVIKPFSAVPDGEIYPRDFAKGDAVSGGLATVAVREGWAEMPAPAKPKKKD